METGADMRSINLSVTAEKQADGSTSLVMKVDGLSGEEHDRLASYLHDPICRMLELATQPEHDVCSCEDCERRRAAVGRPPRLADPHRRLQ